MPTQFHDQDFLRDKPLSGRVCLYIVCTALGLSLTACAAAPQSAPTKTTSSHELVIYSFNDFHGHLQARQPVPAMVYRDAEHASKVAAGGYAYFASVLAEARLRHPQSILVGAGDMIGASPMNAALLDDEPVIEALNRLNLSVSSLGNHELDQGKAALRRKIDGKCPDQICAFADFSGARFSYIAANLIDTETGKPWLQPYVIRQIGELKIGFIGAVTTDTAHLVSANGIEGLNFEDEVTAVNRYVPELLSKGVDSIVLLIHEGANYRGEANDTSYQCPGLQGRIINIVKGLDPAIGLVISGHTHQAYTCKIEGRLVVQARSYGAYLTETRLQIDPNKHRVMQSDSRNILVDQATYTPNTQAAEFVAKVDALTQTLRSREIAVLTQALTRQGHANSYDSDLGNLVADAQLNFAQKQGGADIAFINSGGIRSDLLAPENRYPYRLQYGDLFAVQPFKNQLIRMQLSGKQIIALLHQQWRQGSGDEAKKLAVSSGFSYVRGENDVDGKGVSQVSFKGKALEENALYRVVVNQFLADGGDGFTVLKAGTQRASLGADIEALEFYLRQVPNFDARSKEDRIVKP